MSGEPVTLSASDGAKTEVLMFRYMYLTYLVDETLTLVRRYELSHSLYLYIPYKLISHRPKQ